MTSPTRRSVMRAAAGTGGVAAAAALGLGGAQAREHWDGTPLLSDSVALTAPGARRAVAAGRADDLLPGTRIATGARGLDRLAADERVVREAVSRAATARDLDGDARDLLLGAALDLHVLSAGLAAPIASWAASWRYVWPRDSAHVAVAWVRLGLADRAAGIVQELAQRCGVGEDAGWFAARTVPGTGRVPDDRERQLDGTGWFLWALDETSAAVPGLLDEAAVMSAAGRCARRLLELTDGGRRLPIASPDYWEVPESRPTIGTCALVLVGLERAGRLLAGTDAGCACAAAATRLRALIALRFGPSGYGRYAGREGADAGMLFLLPPYSLAPDPAVAAHLDAAQRAMSRPAGGVAPGALWRRDGISWTPQTAMLAQARAALGDAEGSRALLDWLAAHRTASGSLPEKVTATGAPASVAPLSWTAALVATALLPVS